MKYVVTQKTSGQVPVDLKKLGQGEVCYVRQYKVKGETAWVLYAADGTALSVQKTADEARANAVEGDLDIICVH